MRADNRREMLQGLRRLVEKYVTDASVAGRLLENLDEDHVKYVLGEFEIRKVHDVTAEEREFIKDLFFHFC